MVLELIEGIPQVLAVEELRDVEETEEKALTHAHVEADDALDAKDMFLCPTIAPPLINVFHVKIINELDYDNNIESVFKLLLHL